MKRKVSCRIIVLFLCIACFSTVSQAQNLTPDWIKHGYAINSSNAATNAVNEMITDKHGNVYVLSDNYGTINIDGHIAASDSSGRYSLTSWDCNGSFRWMKTIRTEANNGFALNGGLAVDTLEGIYIAGQGYAFDSVFFDSDTVLTPPTSTLFLLKYNSAGAFQWLRLPALNAIAIDSSASLGLSVTENGDVNWCAYLNPGSYAGGAFSLTNNQYGVLKYNAMGSFQNFIPLSMSSSKAPNSSDLHFAQDVQNNKFYISGSAYPDYLGNVVIGTNTVATVGNDAAPGFLAAFTGTGSNTWMKQSSPDKFCGILKPDIDKDGNVYIFGYTETGSVFNGDTAVNPHAANMYVGMLFVMAMDSNGNRLWVSHAATSQIPYIDDIKYKNNRVVVAGEYHDSLWWDNQILPRPANYSTNIFLAHLDAGTGSVIEIDSLNRSQSCVTPAITLDKNSNLYLGGSFDNSLSFGSTALSAVSNYYDWFIAKYKNVACNCNLLQPEFSLTSSPGGQSYSVSYNGDTPYTSIAWNFGDGTTASGIANPSHTYTAIGNYPVCVTVVNGCGSNSICHWVNISTTGINDVPSQQDVSVYPNPGSEEINILNATAGMILDLYNLQGQKLGRYTLKGADDHLNIKSLTPGVYLLRFTDNNGIQHTTRLLKQ